MIVFACPTFVHAQSGWTWQNPLPQGNTLYAVHMIDSNTAIAFGAVGTVIRTTDRGARWSNQAGVGGTSQTLIGVSFID